MFTKNSIFFVLSLLILPLLLSGTAAASPSRAAIGTGFSYQGRLTVGGAPADGSFDFKFSLYDAKTDGNPVGSTISKDAVLVSEGLFMVQLDFGAVFDGSMLYLQISVRPSSSGETFTVLSKRQALTAAPYASYAASAPWSGLTGIPGGFADGTDDGNTYQNVFVVAKSGGDFTSIQAALESINDASDGNRYLVYVAPGVYSERVIMKPYVDIEGAGELTTKITFTGSESFETGTVLGADNAELRFLTVENTGDAFFATAIYTASTSPRLTHVTAKALGGTNSYGVYNYQSSPTMTSVTAVASGVGTYNYGVYNDESSPMMTNVTASASGGTFNIGVNNSISSPPMNNVSASASGGSANFGIQNGYSSPKMNSVTAYASGGSNSYGVYNYESSPTMTNVTARASEGNTNLSVWNQNASPIMMDVIASASGGNTSIGIQNDGSSPTMTNVTARASGGIIKNYGISNLDTSSVNNTVLVNNSMISASGTNSYGIYNSPTSSGYDSVEVKNSEISGDNHSVHRESGFSLYIGTSQLRGPISGTGITCVYVYNIDYDAITCP